MAHDQFGLGNGACKTRQEQSSLSGAKKGGPCLWRGVCAKHAQQVTNVGPSKSTYEAKRDAPFGMNVTVEPNTLTFTSSNQKKLYNLKIENAFIQTPPMTTTFHFRLYPDITAPGVDILAAWSKAAPMSMDPLDKRVVGFNIVSGTSMATPHATGAAAYVRSFHPDWSPAAIKSALMTTASTLDATLDGNQAAELGYGAGQINPLKAINPGLVYDADVNSYINMLCSQGYNETSLRLLTGEFITCSSNLSKNGVWEFNYPSIMVISNVSEPIFAQFPRTVTNVGPAKSTYEAKIDAPFGMNVTVEPNALTFTSSNQKKLYNLKIESRIVPDDYALLSGALTWSYGNYSVRSPIVVYYVKQ